MNVRRWISAATTLLLSLFLSVTLAHAQDHDDRDHHDQDNRGYQGDHDRGNRDRAIVTTTIVSTITTARFRASGISIATGAFRNHEGRYWHNDGSLTFAKASSSHPI